MPEPHGGRADLFLDGDPWEGEWMMAAEGDFSRWELSDSWTSIHKVLAAGLPPSCISLRRRRTDWALVQKSPVWFGRPHARLVESSGVGVTEVRLQVGELYWAAAQLESIHSASVEFFSSTHSSIEESSFSGAIGKSRVASSALFDRWRTRANGLMDRVGRTSVGLVASALSYEQQDEASAGALEGSSEPLLEL